MFTLRARDPPAMMPERLPQIERMFRDAVEAGVCGGVVYQVAVGGRTVAWQALGSAQVEPVSRPMELETVFDLASVTKTVTAGTLATMLLAEGRLALDQPAVEVVPELAFAEQRRISVRHLLTHTSGLPCVTTPGVTAMTAGGDTRRVLFETLFALPLRFAPGTGIEYTCLNFLVLTLLIERLTGEPLDQLCRRRIFGPLGMAATGFNPPPPLAARAAATSACRWRGRMLVGEVQDTHALAMGGVSGNAGLFSTAADLTNYAQMIAGGGALGGVRLLAPETVALMTANHTERLADHVAPLTGGRGLSWDTSFPGWWGGGTLSERSAGKTGWTGTSVAVDLERRLSVVILTNRHQTDPTENRIAALRPVWHDTIVTAVEAAGLVEGAHGTAARR